MRDTDSILWQKHVKCNKEGQGISSVPELQGVGMLLDTFVKIGLTDTHNANSKVAAGEMSVTLAAG